jgi:starch synthase
VRPSDYHDGGVSRGPDHSSPPDIAWQGDATGRELEGMRVVFISAECEPWAKTGGLGDVVDALARAVATGQPGAEGAQGAMGPADREPDTEALAAVESIQRTVEAVAADRAEGGEDPADDEAAQLQSHARVVQQQVWLGTGGVMGESGPSPHVERPVDVFLPLYRGMRLPADAVSTPLAVPDPMAPDGITEVRLVQFEARGYRIRLIDHPPAFDREGFYGDESGDYPDNGWRFGLLCRAALEALLDDERPVDVLHLHDWQSMPAVLYRDVAYEGYPLVSRAAVMVTIHNLAYQGWLTLEQLAGMATPDEIAELVAPGANGLLLLREGIKRAELVNTVSPGYADEIRQPQFGMGMDPLLRDLGHRFGGIINGLDTAVWDPATDPALPANYSRADRSGKVRCRRALLSELGFDPDDSRPLLGMIGRLDPQKGFDLLAHAARDLMVEGARIVALGTGDPRLVSDLRGIAARHSDAVAVVEKFDRGLARRIYAGADLFVMPSRFEPCGQGQMIAMRYGTPAIVHRTGGLEDTVVDVDAYPDEGTGFVFDSATPEALVDACGRAMEYFRNGGPEWEALQDRGMAIDWSWEAGPAEQYAASYRRAVSLRRER